jgi:lysozyme family protein
VASGALDLLSALQPQKSTNANVNSSLSLGGFLGQQDAGANVGLTSATTSSPPSNPLSPNVLAFLIANQSAQQAGPGQPLSPFQQALFAKLDTNGDGVISKSEFEAAFAQNSNTDQADALFAKLDVNGDGSIDQNEFAKATQRHGHHHHHAEETSNSQDDATTSLTSLLKANASTTGATQSTVSNPDGSSTITITYADGSKVTLTTPAQATNGTPASATPGTPSTSTSPNVLETLIALQAQLIGSKPVGTA